MRRLLTVCVCLALSACISRSGWDPGGTPPEGGSRSDGASDAASRPEGGGGDAGDGGQPLDVDAAVAPHCGPTVPCGGGSWCNAGACEACYTAGHCGPGCAVCSGTTPDCGGSLIGCICNANSCGPAEWCNAGRCDACDTTSRCGPTCSPCGGETPDCGGAAVGCICNATSCGTYGRCNGRSCDDCLVCDGLIAHWKFDETSGTVAADATGNGHDGTLLGISDPDDWLKGPFDNALRFDGAWSRMTIESLDSPNYPLSGTLSMWVMAAWSTNTDPRPFWDEWNTNRNLMSLRMHDTPGYLRFFALDNRGSTKNICWATIRMQDYAWQHIALVWDSVASEITLYVDGDPLYVCDTTVESDGVTPIAPGWVPDGQRAIVGKDHATQTFRGMIDNVRLYERPLRAAEIAALYEE